MQRVHELTLSRQHEEHKGRELGTTNWIKPFLKKRARFLFFLCESLALAPTMRGNDDVVIPLIEKRPTTSSGLLNEALDKLGFGACCVLRREACEGFSSQKGSEVVGVRSVCRVCVWRV